MAKDHSSPPGEVPPRKGARVRMPGESGTTFYIERGRPFVSMSDYRDRHRSPEARIAVKLSRELTRLADDFPRFRLALNRLQHHVLVQVRSPRSKAYLLAPD